MSDMPSLFMPKPAPSPQNGSVGSKYTSSAGYVLRGNRTRAGLACRKSLRLEVQHLDHPNNNRPGPRTNHQHKSFPSAVGKGKRDSTYRAKPDAAPVPPRNARQVPADHGDPLDAFSQPYLLRKVRLQSRDLRASNRCCADRGRVRHIPIHDAMRE